MMEELAVKFKMFGRLWLTEEPYLVHVIVLHGRSRDL